ncbi:hypothetical protein [Ruegeria arenilitoris]|uniref:hypothetical protein n=1 Tax=Ruegeria arenilitoris TaxID=1173585 RepID=UPI001CFE073E|nr:hypothetical protein [Ruegeria arenilitoris]
MLAPNFGAKLVQAFLTRSRFRSGKKHLAELGLQIRQGSGIVEPEVRAELKRLGEMIAERLDSAATFHNSTPALIYFDTPLVSHTADPPDRGLGRSGSAKSTEAKPHRQTHLPTIVEHRRRQVFSNETQVPYTVCQGISANV